MKIIINSPSLDINKNVSGISSVTGFIISANNQCNYLHFETGKPDSVSRGLSWFLNILKSYILWIKMLLSNRDAYVHFNIPFEKRAILRDSPFILLCRLFKFRSIIHFHGGEYLLNKTLPGWLRSILRIVISNNQPLIVLSTEEKKVVETIFPESELFILPNCIDLKYASEFQRTFPDNEELILLFMGRISFNKGIHTIYNAMVMLRETGVNFRFVLAGKGPEEEAYVKKFTSLLKDQFEFAGVVSGREKVDLLKRSNIFLLPSYFEGLPMALLETMSFGLVPVCTNVGSIKYIVKDSVNGKVVNIDSPVELYESLNRLYSDASLRKKLSLNAHDFIFSNYNPDQYINTLNSIYHYDNGC